MVKISNERLAELEQWATDEQFDCAEDDMPVSAEYYADVVQIVALLRALEPQQEEAKPAQETAKYMHVDADMHIKPVAWTDTQGLFYLSQGYGIDVSSEKGLMGRTIGLFTHPTPVQKVQESQTVSEEMVERISEILFQKLSGLDADYDEAARAVIRVMRKPTDKMLAAGRDADLWRESPLGVYQWMLDAALEPSHDRAERQWLTEQDIDQ